MKKSVYVFCLIVIFGLFALPILNLFFVPEFNHFLMMIQNENTLKAIQNTLLLSVLVGFFCLILGLPLAWVLSRTDMPWRSQLKSWFCLPYAIPPFVGAIGWIILANPTSGLLTQWLGIPFNIYSLSGLVFVETCFLFSFVLLTSLTVLDRMDSSLEEAARLSGASSFKVFIDISLPLLKPAMISGFILSFLSTAASFGVPALIGGPARIYLLTTQIYSYQRMGTAQGMQMSIAVSVLLASFSFLLLYISQKFFSVHKNYSVGGKASRASLVNLGKMKWPLFVLLLFTLFIIFILPLMGLVLSSLSPVQGVWNLSSLSWVNYDRVLFETEETLRAISQSLLLGVAAAVICTLFSFVFNYFIYRTKFNFQNLAQLFVHTPFSTPGTVLALALILAFSQGYFGWGPSLYNTLFLILLAYVIKYCSLSLKIMGDGYQQIHPSLEEAARVSGASWGTLMLTIYWPLLKTSIMASVFLVFMPVVSELTMTILLTGPGLETIGSLIFQLQEYSDMGGGGASVLSVIVVLFILVLNYSLKFISKGRYGL
jgi:iron(III) transport system permease protein